MDKSKILNIADNLSLLKENHRHYIEIKEKDDFESYNKKKNLYNNWIVTLCYTYNSLLKYYKNDTNECWDKINLFVSKVYKYENIEITLKELIKKYRNKNVHSENPNSVENNLLPAIVSVVELEELQTMLIDVINCELEKTDINQMVTHVLKSGSNVIAYTKFINSINESMRNATTEEKEVLVVPYSIIKNVFSILTDETLLTEEILSKLENDLDIAYNSINSSEFIKIMLGQPNGQNALEFLDKIKKAKSSCDFYDCCIEFRNNILNNR